MKKVSKKASRPIQASSLSAAAYDWMRVFVIGVSFLFAACYDEPARKTAAGAEPSKETSRTPAVAELEKDLPDVSYLFEEPKKAADDKAAQGKPKQGAPKPSPQAATKVPGQGTSNSYLATSQFTAQESWVVKQVCAGQMADLNVFDPQNPPLDPFNAERWSKRRILRQAFLDQLLQSELCDKPILRQGTVISGAWLVESIDLSNISLKRRTGFLSSRFETHVQLFELKCAESLWFVGSAFLGELGLASTQIGGNLVLTGSRMGSLKLGAATVKGNLAGSQVVVSGDTNMDKIHVGGSLALGGKDGGYGTVILNSAILDGALVMNDGKFGTVWMRGTRIANRAFMNATFQKVFVSNAHVHSFEFNQAKIIDQLTIDNSVVDDDIWLGAISSLSKKVVIQRSTIGKNLSLGHATLAGLDLTGTQVTKELGLHPGRNLMGPKWLPGSDLTLRNATAGSLVDMPNAWPPKVLLTGFTYTWYGAPDQAHSSAGTREVEWFKNLLARQEAYNPQPYQQLAGTLMKAGYKDKAKEILYLNGEQERMNASFLDKPFLIAMDWFIGYGFQIHRALIWVFALVLVGAYAIRNSPEGKANGLLYGFTYSFDMLLPVIKLRDMHYKIDIQSPARYYFYFHKIMGYVLAGFLLSGLTGLTKTDLV